MRSMRKRRRAHPLAVVLAVVVAIGLWMVLTSHGEDRSLYPPTAGSAPVTLYLVDNGFHSDLVVPAGAIAADSHITGRAAASITDKPWIMIGWGDAHYYTGSAFSWARAGDALRAAFMPGNLSVVHLQGLPRTPDKVFVAGAVHPIVVASAGLAKLVARVDQSMVADSAGRPVRVTTRVDADEGFFQSNEHFNLLHLCNHWIAQLLNAAGLPTTPVLDTLPVGLKLDLRLRAKT